MSGDKATVIDLDFLISKSFDKDEVDKINPEQLIDRLYSQQKLDLSDCNIEEITHLESMTQLKSLYLRNVFSIIFLCLPPVMPVLFSTSLRIDLNQ